MSALRARRPRMFDVWLSVSLVALLAVLLVAIRPAQADETNKEHGGAVHLLTSVPFSLSIPGYDISWVEQATGRYFLADSGNNAVDWFNAKTTDPGSFVVRQLAKGAFAGGGTAACRSSAPSPFNCGGPNGVLTDDQHRVWATDSPTGATGLAAESSVKVISTTAPYNDTVVSTGGKFRSDELSFDPRDHLVLVANDADGFLAWINTDTLTVVGKFYYDGNLDGQPPTFPGHVFDHGLEQSVYVPSTGLFYQAVPGHGVDVFEPNPVNGVGQLIAVYGTPGCVGGPTGLTLAAQLDLVGACQNGGIVVDARTGHNETLIPNLGGADEVWFNRGDGNVYFGIIKLVSVMPLNLPGTLGVASGIRETFVSSLPSGMFGHSVAAYEANNHIFVPTTDKGIEIFTSS